MIETSALRKNKIALADYNYRKDIENRLLMADFSTLDLEVLEEILYSPITVSIKKILKNIDAEESKVRSILEKLSRTGLISLVDDMITVDKEMRKYYESQVMKFDEDFAPGMEFLQGLLRKVPIHVLPSWYSIPRTSNNIFDSLVEKYLLTPQIFQRYLAELHFGDPHLSGIVREVYAAPELKVLSSDLLKKLSLSREQFEECMLHLEFHFVCCLGYSKSEDRWEEAVTPFHEWREYVLFLKNTEVPSLSPQAPIARKRSSDFAFNEDLEALLFLIKKQPLTVKAALAALLSSQNELQEKEAALLIEKALLLKFVEAKESKLHFLLGANQWLGLSHESKSLYLYRHPLNRLMAEEVSDSLLADRSVREAEKSISRALHKGWVFFDEFIKGVTVPLNDDSPIMLRRCGKSWKYALPAYSEEEKVLIKAVVFQWLFEMGAVNIGSSEGRECLCITSFGQALFGR